MSYPYHSMLLPIEYYKTRGHFPTSCSHIQRVQKIQGTNCALKIISRSKSVLAHWPKSHLFKHLNKAVCDSKLQQGGLGETLSWLNFFLPWAIFFFLPFCHPGLVHLSPAFCTNYCCHSSVFCAQNPKIEVYFNTSEGQASKSNA